MRQVRRMRLMHWSNLRITYVATFRHSGSGLFLLVIGARHSGTPATRFTLATTKLWLVIPRERMSVEWQTGRRPLPSTPSAPNLIDSCLCFINARRRHNDMGYRVSAFLFGANVNPEVCVHCSILR